MNGLVQEKVHLLDRVVYVLRKIYAKRAQDGLFGIIFIIAVLTNSFDCKGA